MEPTTPAPTQTPTPEQQPAAPTPADSPAPATPAQATGENPGSTLGIISIILPFLGLSLVGLILAIIGMKKSKKAGMKNTPALIGLILSIIGMVVGTAIFLIILLTATAAIQRCQNLGPGTHYEDGVTYTCS